MQRLEKLENWQERLGASAAVLSAIHSAGGAASSEEDDNASNAKSVRVTDKTEFLRMMQEQSARRPGEKIVQSYKTDDGSKHLCMMVPSKMDDGKARRTRAKMTNEGIIEGAAFELIICDSGSTGVLIPENWMGKTIGEILDIGSRKESDIEFGTADPHAAALRPICRGAFTGTMVDKEGVVWVIHWDTVYILPKEACSQAFLSPAATRSSWIRSNNGVDSVAMTCGSEGLSSLSLISKGEIGDEHPETKGEFKLAIDSSTYFGKIQAIESLRVYKGDIIRGDVSRALKVLEGQHASAGTTSADWLDEQQVKGWPIKGHALVKAYEDAATKSKMYDETAEADDEAMRQGVEKGICEFIPNRVREAHKYNWIARREHRDARRTEEIRKARGKPRVEATRRIEALDKAYVPIDWRNAEMSKRRSATKQRCKILSEASKGLQRRGGDIRECVRVMKETKTAREVAAECNKDQEEELPALVPFDTDDDEGSEDDSDEWPRSWHINEARPSREKVKRICDQMIRAVTEGVFPTAKEEMVNLAELRDSERSAVNKVTFNERTVTEGDEDPSAKEPSFPRGPKGRTGETRES